MQDETGPAGAALTLANYEAYSRFHEDLNKILHAMASHLHRYASKLTSLQETLSEIIAHHQTFFGKAGRSSNDSQFHRIEDGLHQVSLQLRPIKDFEHELEKKLETILALVRPTI